MVFVLLDGLHELSLFGHHKKATDFACGDSHTALNRGAHGHVLPLVV
jgi:hypothetical protein